MDEKDNIGHYGLEREKCILYDCVKRQVKSANNN